MEGTWLQAGHLDDILDFWGYLLPVKQLQALETWAFMEPDPLDWTQIPTNESGDPW